MEKLWDILTDEKKSWDWPWWAYMFVVPAALVALMAVAGWLETVAI